MTGSLSQHLTDGLEVAIHVTEGGLRVWLVNQLVGLGFSPSRVRAYGTATALRNALPERKIDLLIVEHGEGRGTGPELVRKLRLFERGGRKSIAILLTKDLAEAREARWRGRSGADLVLTPPVPAEDFRALILRFVLDRSKVEAPKEGASVLVKPVAVNGASVRVAERSVAQAVENFDLARSLSYGLTERHHSRERILRDYEGLMNAKRWPEAYEVSRRALPVLPEFQQRFDEVLKLALANRRIDDLDELYRVYTGFEKRTDRLNRAMTAALVVGARAFARQGRMAECEDAYRKAIVSSGARASIVREAITTMLNAGRLAAAKAFFARFKADAIGSVDHVAMEVWLLEADEQETAAIQKARALYLAGTRDPALCAAFARALHRVGKFDFAEGVALESMRLWPEHAEDFRPYVRDWAGVTPPARQETRSG